ncbi:MAG: hypothetical protein A4E70_02614 [Syntrophus sp. PtaU1.Bin005]|nr:MAG: hypothetical protein A4E70_02614 [Syntrophus sp. PtaU1.Bin005]
MNLDASRRCCPELARCINQRFGDFFIEESLGGHSADDTRAANGDVAVLVGKKNGRTHALIASARRVCPVDSRQDGDSHLFQFRMTEEAGSTAAPVCIEFFLFRKSGARAVDQPDDGDIEDLCHVGGAEIVVRLTGNPSTHGDFVVEADQHAPLAADPGQAVHDARNAFLVSGRIIKSMQRAESPGIHDVFNTLPDSHIPFLVNIFCRDPRIFCLINCCCNVGIDFLNLGDVVFHPLNLRRLESLAQIVHLFKILSHSKLS